MEEEKIKEKKDKTPTAIFLTELRKEKGLTQEELATCIKYSRSAVAKWESGYGTPDIDALQILSAFYEISINEIMNGARNKKKEEENTKIDDIIIQSATNEKKQAKKRFKIKLKITIFTFIFIMLGLYFITSYNTVKGYTITGSSDEFIITDGILLTSKMKNYLYLGKIKPLVEIKDNEYNLEVFYIENENEHVVLSTDKENLTFLEKYGNYELIPKELFEHLEDLNIKITYLNGNNEITINTMKLNVKLTFVNDKLIYLKDEKDLNNSESIEESSNLVKELENLGYLKISKYKYCSNKQVGLFKLDMILNTFELYNHDYIFRYDFHDNQIQIFNLDNKVLCKISVENYTYSKSCKVSKEIINDFLNELKRIKELKM